MNFTIPIRPRPTPRPRGKQGQRAYYPTEYQSYKDELEWRIKAAAKGNYIGPCQIAIGLWPDAIDINITPTDAQRNGLRGDIDNIYKGIADALETAGVIENDRDVHSLVVRFM